MLGKLVTAIGLSLTASSGFAASIEWLPEVVIRTHPGRYAESPIADGISTQSGQGAIRLENDFEDKP